jgi:hypothetical protein
MAICTRNNVEALEETWDLKDLYIVTAHDIKKGESADKNKSFSYINEE